MKALVSTAALLFALVAPTAAQAQIPFHLRLGFDGAYGPGTPNVSPNVYGGGVVLEPMLDIIAGLSGGLRLEGGILAGASVSNGTNASAGLRTQGALLAKAEYGIGPDALRPFVGFGAGMYALSAAAASTNGGALTAGTFFGFAPELGLNLGGFRLAGLYHIITLPAGSPSANYFALELSFRLF